MGMIASQITSLTIVFSTVYLDTDQRKHQSSASLAFVQGIHRRSVNPPHKWPVKRKMLPFDDVIMCERILTDSIFKTCTVPVMMWLYMKSCSMFLSSSNGILAPLRHFLPPKVCCNWLLPWIYLIPFSVYEMFGFHEYLVIHFGIGSDSLTMYLSVTAFCWTVLMLEIHCVCFILSKTIAGQTSVCETTLAHQLLPMLVT